MITDNGFKETKENSCGIFEDIIPVFVHHNQKYNLE
jgi:hypothetical protein